MSHTGSTATAEMSTSAADESVEQHLIESSMLALPISAAAVVIAETGGEFGVAASSSEKARLLAVVQLTGGTGPCVQAIGTGRVVTVADTAAESSRWPAFARLAAEFRFQSACALPLRVHDEHLGALLVIREESGAMSPFDITIGQALTDVAAIGIALERKVSVSDSLNRQLQHALESRIIIEQAKGVLAERGSIDTGEAFTLLRSHARRTRQRLSDLARAVVEGTDTSALLSVPR